MKRHTLANALRVAAEVYSADAATFSKLAVAAVSAELAKGHVRTATTFAAQAVEVRKLADRIEQESTITLED